MVLHYYCDTPDCNLDHCSGVYVDCTKNNCICDKRQYTECRYKNILNNNENELNGKHIIQFSNVMVQWCKKCKAHNNCGLKECSFKHCICFD